MAATFTMTKYTRTADGSRVWDGEPIVRTATEGTEYAMGWFVAARDEAMGYGYLPENTGTSGSKVYLWLRHPETGKQIHLTYTTR